MSASLTSTRWPRARWREALCVAALMAAMAYRCVGYGESVDLHWADEFSYLVYGNRLLMHGEAPPFAWAPLYATAMALVDALLPNDVHVFDVMYWICRLLVAAAAYWAVRPMVHPLVALAMGTWVGMLDPVARDMGPGVMALGNVYAMGAAMFAATWGCLVRGRWLCAAAGALAMVFVRGEYSVWVVAFGVVMCVLRIGAPRGRVAAIVGVGVALMAIALAPESSRNRSWLAFRQFYGGYAMQQRYLERYGANPQLSDAEALRAFHDIENAAKQPDRVVLEDFGPVSSVTQALSSDPRRFLGFVWQNVRAVPWQVEQSLFPHNITAKWFGWTIVAMACVGVIVGVARMRSAPQTHGVALAAMLATAPTAIAAVGVTMPRFELLLCSTFGVLFFAAIGVDRIGDRLWRTWHASRGLPALLVVLGVLHAVALPRPFARRGESSLPVRDSLSALMRVEPPADARVLTSDWMMIPVQALQSLGRLPGFEVATLRGLGFLDASTEAPSLVDLGIGKVIWDRRLEFEASMAPSVKRQLAMTPWREALRVGGTVVHEARQQ